MEVLIWKSDWYGYWQKLRYHLLQSFRSPSGFSGVPINGGFGGLDALRQVEAKYPALLFKQQLTAYVEKLYGMLRDNLKKEISPLLTACIQVGALSYTDWLLDFSTCCHM
jgi:hypothetical protein